MVKKLDSWGKLLVSTNSKLQKELSNVKLQKIYAQCENYGSSLVFVAMTMTPIILHIFLQVPWYISFGVTLFMHFYFSAIRSRRYDTAALQVISDYHLLNLIRSHIPLWTHQNSEPCGWLNDFIAQCWDQMNLYASKKVCRKISATFQNHIILGSRYC